MRTKAETVGRFGSKGDREASRRGALLVFCEVLCLLACAALADPGIERLTIGVGSSRIVAGKKIRQVAVSNPAVVDVQPVSTSELLVTGLAPGTTQLFVWDAAGRRQYDVTALVATRDAELFARQIGLAVAVPTVKAEAAGDKVLLRGQVGSEEEARRAETVAKAIYPKVDNLLVVRPGSSAANIAAINDTLKAWNAKAEPAPDGRVTITGEAPNSGALASIRKALEPWAKDIQFIFDVKTAKPPQQEAVEAITMAFAKWKLKAAPMPDGRVLVEGSVPNKDALAEAQAILKDWPATVAIVDRIGLAEPAEAEQVLIRARIVELDRSDTRNLGVDWTRILFTTGEGGNTTYSAEDQPFIIGQPTPGPYPLFGGPPLSQLDPIGARINALILQDRAKLLSQPSVVTASGRKASILIGGEIPIPVPQSGIGGAGVVTIEYKQFGIQLDVIPTVAENSEIVMEVKPEVSSLDYADGIIMSGFRVPALRTRRAEATVHVPSCCSIAIGGLLSRDDTRNLKALPLLGQIPILGQFFKTVTRDKNDSELLIIVTPEIVRAASSAGVLKDEGPDTPRPKQSKKVGERLDPECDIGPEVDAPPRK